MALLDTTVLIDLTRSPGSPAHRRAVLRLAELYAAGGRLCTSRINEAEFRVGPERSADRPRELEAVEGVLAGLLILEFDSESARRYAMTQAVLLDRGLPAGDMDTLIAAVALANNQVLVTRNPRHFANVPGLVVETY